jgi:hypothetical protein
MLRIAATVAALALLNPARGDVMLPASEGQWERRLFELGAVPPEVAAHLSFVRDTDQGDCLAVGPWRAGRHSARFETVGRLTVLAGQVRGWYRTESLPPFLAAVYVIFHREDGRRRIDTFDLPPSAEWRQFAVPIRRAPLGARAVSVGVGLRDKTEGRVWFCGLAASERPLRVEFPPSPGPPIRPAPPDQLPPAGTIRLTNHEGVWWLVTPEGQPLFSSGTDGPYFDASAGLAEGRRYFAQMRALGFNSLAGWTYLPGWAMLNDVMAKEGEQPLVLFRSLETGTAKESFGRLVPGGHAFPDPFDPRWEQALRNRVRSLAEHVAGKPWFGGLFADNEVNHRELYRHVWTPHCAAALRAFLENRYPDIRALNGAWGSQFQSFDELIARRPEPLLRQGRMFEDFFAFSREIVRRDAETAARVIREELPGHLVFSNRFMLDDVAHWLDYLDLYAVFDGIAINIYPGNLNPGLSESERLILELAHRKTGRPVLIGEWSIPALDSGLYDNPDRLDWSFDEAVETQGHRARQAAKVLVDFYNLPYIVGAHWFIWSDFDSAKRQANRGLYRANGEPWGELQDALRTANHRIGAHTVRVIPAPALPDR